MSNMTPVHKDETPAAEIYKQLDKRAEDGTLAASREYSTEDTPKPEAPKDAFQELTEDELEKLAKKDLLAYMKEKAAADERKVERRIKEEGDAVRAAAIHGLPRQPKGEMLPTGRRRGEPVAMLDDEGNERKNKKGKRVTRTDW